MAKVSFTGEKAVFLLHWTEDGSGDFLVSIEAEADDFRGHADGHVVGSDMRRFIEDLKRLDQSRNGKAQLSSVAQGEFKVTIQAIDRAGHMGVSGVLRYCALDRSGRIKYWSSSLSLIRHSYPRP
jgi:hypothetical protein